MTKEEQPDDDDILVRFPREIFQPSPDSKKQSEIEISPKKLRSPVKTPVRSPKETNIDPDKTYDTEAVRRSQRVRRLPQRLNL